MVLRLIKYFLSDKKKLCKFLIVGGTAFLVNISFYYIYLLTLYLKNNNFDISQFNVNEIIETGKHIKTYINSLTFHKDIANIVAIEISVLFNFIMSRHWTWNHIKKETGKLLYFQCFKFHLAVLPGMIFRSVSFFILNHFLHIHDLLNIMLGVAGAMILNFLFYDKVVFSKKNEL